MWHLTRSLIMPVLLCCFVQVYAQDKEILTIEEMKTIAKNVAEIQFRSETLQALRDHFSELELMLDRESALLLYSDLDRPLNLQVNIWPPEFEWDGITTFRILSLGDYHDHGKVLAIGHDASLFLLTGFSQDDFNLFVRQKVGEVLIESDAMKLVRYFLEMKFYRLLSLEIVESTNIKEYSARYPMVEPLRIMRTNVGFQISLYMGTQDDSPHDIVEKHQFFIGFQGEFEHESEILLKTFWSKDMEE